MVNSILPFSSVGIAPSKYFGSSFSVTPFLVTVFLATSFCFSTLGTIQPWFVSAGVVLLSAFFCWFLTTIVLPLIVVDAGSFAMDGSSSLSVTFAFSAAAFASSTAFFASSNCFWACSNFCSGVKTVCADIIKGRNMNMVRNTFFMIILLLESFSAQLIAKTEWL